MNARYLAAEALMRVEEGGYSSLVLDAELKRHTLPSEERAFASAVFYTVLEHQNSLDYILNQFLKKSVTKLDAPVRQILRCGLAQLRYMETPPSAAVNESVKLTRAFGKSSASGLVNAVLRHAGSFSLEKATFASEAERLSVVGSVSLPVAEHFLRYYPQDAEAILTRTAAKTETAIRVNLLRTAPDKLQQMLEQQGASCRPGPLPGSLLVRFAGSPAETDAFQKGLFHVQGLTSQLAALALEAAPGEKAVDLCAAPGGKTLTLAQQMQDRGELFSCDITPNRVSLIEKAVQRCGIGCVHVLCNDATKPNPVLAGADCVLADVPCSGLGILQKKPDIRYKSLESLSQLAEMQRRILENAAGCLQKGGRLVYSTCTLNPEENEKQIESFLQRHSNFKVKRPCCLPAEMLQGPFGALSLPNRTGMDGFFICAMEKE